MKKESISLNKEQLEAVNFINGNLLIMASAGTGKTTTIVERFVNLVNNHGFNKNEILMTTFTNKAAKDMLKKIYERTNSKPEYLGTMHSIFLNILREKGSFVLPDIHFTIIDEPDKKKILKNIFEKEKIQVKADNIKYFMIWISRFKNLGILAEKLSEERVYDSPEEGLIEEVIGDDIIKIDPRLRQYVNKVYKKYDEDLRKHNQIDLDDILLLTLKLLENNPEVIEHYRKKFKAIMVDEAQDINVVQIRILNLLQDNNMCLIGDDCQNIYEWRGSSNELVFDFNENQNKIFLKDNYRSGKKIINSVNKVIAGMSFKIDKKLRSTKNIDGKIKIESFYNSDEETDFILNEVEELIESGVKKDEIAVLFRTNRIGKELEREFRRNRIPCHLSKSKDFFEREEIKDILSFLKLKINPYSRIDFERILLLLSGFGKIKVDNIIETANKNKCSFIEVLNLKKELKINPITEKELYKLHSSIINKETNPIETFLKDFGYLEYLNQKYIDDQDRLEDKIENINVLTELSVGLGNNRESIKIFLDSLMDIEKKEKTKDKVTLSTIHSAKGLEWEYVFLASCNEKTLPYYINDLGKLKRDSELRLFYVAISRAKLGLFITSYTSNNWGKDISRSQFIDILEDKKSKEKIKEKFYGFKRADRFR